MDPADYENLAAAFRTSPSLQAVDEIVVVHEGHRAISPFCYSIALYDNTDNSNEHQKTSRCEESTLTALLMYVIRFGLLVYYNTVFLGSFCKLS